MPLLTLFAAFALASLASVPCLLTYLQQSFRASNINTRDPRVRVMPKSLSSY